MDININGPDNSMIKIIFADEEGEGAGEPMEIT